MVEIKNAKAFEDFEGQWKIICMYCGKIKLINGYSPPECFQYICYNCMRNDD
jgi:hypothetical protein